jgi:predicted alpha/beta superfamily hydrolase
MFLVAVRLKEKCMKNRCYACWKSFLFILLAILVSTLALHGQEKGRLVTYKGFRSNFVNPREVDVWLPPGYDNGLRKRYPVVYMHDGQNLFNPRSSYIGVAWDINGAMTSMMNERKIRPAVIVGIWNTQKRIAEYMPQKATTIKNTYDIAGIPIVTHDAIVSDNYLKFIIQEVKPFVDAKYRTLPDQPNTFIMGSSMGALISAYAVSEYPDVFGGAGCLSTHWPAADGAVISYLESHLPDPSTHKFYFDHGTKTLDAEYGPYQRRMDDGMRAAGYESGKNWITRIYEGADHSERSWSKRVDIPLEFLLGK